MEKVTLRAEALLGRLLRNQRGRDAKLLTRVSPALQTLPPTITITSSVGSSPAPLPKEFTPFGENRFPPLSWTLPSDIAADQIHSYVLIVEDPDAPLPSPVVHGVYYGISADKTAISSDDVVLADAPTRTLQGGFQYGVNLRQTVWSGPRPVLAHGPHRYFFQLVALGPPLAVGEKPLGKGELLEALGKSTVVAWGEWVGTYVRDP
ncbi:YbhB/YbcL family Raf kinase inhibitor-like protein [Aspergillus ibericus CBS 121593]|uniref:PEBP-like protein n=1 Tax=Aspergillus ibericus CBS 121593 TaxID=1448316 RepID=A0A395GMB0_9EURO|nr:PEBP-like protein [Aspergillus ibericus CBS 121593]RAK96482.1 PEBP-like protein [Aspergillus ibericus CBS 121593]